MRISSLVILVLSLTVPAAAQEPQHQPLAADATVALAEHARTSGDAVAAGHAATEAPAVTAPLSARLSLAQVAPALMAAPLQGATAARQPLPQLTRPGGSMVGYIADATIESKLRVRFDSALENTFPDRAEFFYAKCGCYSQLDPADPLFDADAPGPRPGVAVDLDFRQLDLWGEYAFGSLASVFVQLPIRWLQPKAFLGGGAGFSDQSGVGDIRAGAKVGYAPAVNHQLTVQGQLYFPSGDAEKGLGTDHVSVEPAVLYNWQANERVIVESQLAVWLPVGGADAPGDPDEKFAGRVLTWGVGSGVNVFTRGTLSVGPVVELVGWRVLSGFQSVAIDASDTNIVNLKFGGRLALDPRNSVYVGFGHALTVETWFSDIWRFEYRVGF